MIKQRCKHRRHEQRGIAAFGFNKLERQGCIPFSHQHKSTMAREGGKQRGSTAGEVKHGHAVEPDPISDEAATIANILC